MRLSTKVLLLALLNIGLLMLLGLVIFVTQYGGDFRPLLIATSREKIDAVSRLLVRDLEDAPHDQWPSIFARYSRAYDVTLLLVDREANLLGGPAFTIPENIVRRIRERPPGQMPPPAGPILPGEDARPERDGAPPRKKGRGGPPGLFIERADGPLTFWVGLRLRAPSYGVPATLLFASSGWLSSSFFFDGRPWLIALGIILVVSAICWLPFIRSLTASVAQLSQATERIAQGHFEIELPHTRTDELGHLGGSINQLSGQLSRFVTGQKRFLADVAHELCSPIARIQFAAGILERRVSEAEREYVADLQSEIEHMSSLVNELLSFTKMGLQPDEVKLQTVHLGQLAQRAVEREGPGDTRLVVGIDPTHRVIADPSLLLRAISNLMRNALRYAGDSGPVHVQSQKHGQQIILTVADSGPGVPEDLIGQVFEPFRRGDPARTRSTSPGGVGLGLAIVKSCIDACRGEITCRNRQPGFEVEVRLPAADA